MSRTNAVSDRGETMPRRLLAMVEELHRRGFQRLRIAPAMSPSGMHWRLDVAAASNIRRSHGAELWDYKGVAARYSSANGEECFGWTDAGDDSPEELATKFLDRFAALCASGEGPDEPYARWYSEMLRATEPDGLVYAHADWLIPRDRLPALGVADDVRVPLPPPGEAG